MQSLCGITRDTLYRAVYACLCPFFRPIHADTLSKCIQQLSRSQKQGDHKCAWRLFSFLSQKFLVKFQLKLFQQGRRLHVGYKKFAIFGESLAVSRK